LRIDATASAATCPLRSIGPVDARQARQLAQHGRLEAGEHGIARSDEPCGRGAATPIRVHAVAWEPTEGVLAVVLGCLRSGVAPGREDVAVLAGVDEERLAAPVAEGGGAALRCAQRVLIRSSASSVIDIDLPVANRR